MAAIFCKIFLRSLFSCITFGIQKERKRLSKKMKTYSTETRALTTVTLARTIDVAFSFKIEPAPPRALASMK